MFGVGEGGDQEKCHHPTHSGLSCVFPCTFLLAGHAACLPDWLCSGSASVSGLGGRQVLVSLICLVRTLTNMPYIDLIALCLFRPPRMSPPLLFGFPSIIFHTTSISFTARRAQDWAGNGDTVALLRGSGIVIYFPHGFYTNGHRSSCFISVWPLTIHLRIMDS